MSNVNNVTSAINGLNNIAKLKSQISTDKSGGDFNELMSQAMTFSGNLDMSNPGSSDSTLNAYNLKTTDVRTAYDKNNASANSTDANSKKVNDTTDRRSTEQAKNNDNSDNKINKTSDNDKVKLNSQEKEDAVSKDIISAVKDITGISEEDIMAMLQNLGMTAIDLLDEDNLMKFMLEINQETDIMSLLVNDGMADTFLQLKSALSDIGKEISNDSENLDEFDFAKNIGNDDGNNEVEKTPEVEVIDLRTGKNDSDSEFKRDNSSSKNTDQGSSDMIMNNLSEITNATLEAQGVNVTSNFTSISIVNQLVEAARVTLTDTVSSMEIMLNPENLGKVNLNITLKEGVMTAQITAENQVTKEAIESQVVMLKEQLNNQGLKVEAIEVTIASHSFEAGYDQNNDNASKGEQSNSKKNKTGIINFDADDLAEEDAATQDIRQEIDQQTGSMVSFKA